MAVTLSDIARDTQSSISLVSAALKGNNSTAKVSEKKRKHILKAAQRMGYRPSHAARALKIGKTNVLGLVIGEIHTPHYGEMIRLLMEEADKHAYSIQIYVTNWDNERGLKAIDILLGGRCDGILLFDGSILNVNNTQYEYIIKNNIPTVMLTNEESALARVGIEWDSGFIETAEYLISKNIKNTLFLGDKVTILDRPKLKSLINVFDRYGLNLGFSECHNRSDLVYKFGLDFNRLDNPPQVILTENDTLATVLLKGLFDAGIKIPETVGVIGYNNTDFSKYCTPALTTIGFNRKAYAQTVIDLMMKIITNGKLCPDGINIPTFLRKQDSA